MFSAARTGAARWLRIVLAVAALVATHATVVQAACVTTCARAVSPSTTVVGDRAPNASHAAASEAALRAAHAAANHAPVEQAVVPPCATSVGALTAVVDVPGVVTVWNAVPLPPAARTRPPSIAPPAPFRPPRAI